MLDSEKELEDYLYCDGSGQFLPADRNYDFCMRQLHIQGYGTMDLVYFDIDHEKNAVVIEIVELKKGSLDLTSVAQIARYRQGLLHYLSLYNIPSDFSVLVNGTLVGEKIIGDDVFFLIDSIPWLDCYAFSLSLGGGIAFKQQTSRDSQSCYWSKKNTSKKTAFPIYIEIKRSLLMKIREEKEIAEYQEWLASQVVANA